VSDARWTSLATATQRVPLIVRQLRLPDDDAIWLASVGLEPGEKLMFIRAALFGDPLHVRMDNGAEFALARALAEEVLVEVVDHKTDDAR
jgi:Fe2+ transport system protein FeoA